MIINDPNSPPEDMKSPPVPMKSDLQHEPQAIPLEAPPPYILPPGPGPAASSSRLPPSPAQPLTPVSVFRPTSAQLVNHFELFSKHDKISGAYLIDPLLPSPAAGLSRRMRRKRDKVWGKSREKTDINASFHTRHGAIEIDLEVIAQSPHAEPARPEDKVPARVFVSSRHGRIHVDVHQTHPTRSLDLHIEGDHGKTVLLLPPTFDGPLVFGTRHSNSVHFLPAFAARSRTLRASDRETIMHCTPPASLASPHPLKPINQMAEDHGDRCLVRTRHGKIFVGISGLDHFEDPQPTGGFFKALGKLFENHGKAVGNYVESQGKMIGDIVESHAKFIENGVSRIVDGPHNAAVAHGQPYGSVGQARGPLGRAQGRSGWVSR